MATTNEPLELSVVIITQNAASSLPRCLQSVASVADDLVILDSGSTDETIAIGQQFGARTFFQPWLGFGPQKNKAVEKAAYNWVLCLDSDEWLSKELENAIRDVKNTSPTYSVYKMARRNRFLGRFLLHGEAYPDFNTRLFHREQARWSDDTVHEKVMTDQPIGLLRGDLLHDSAERLDDYLAKQNRYTTLQANQLVERNISISLFKPVVSALFRFLKGYFFRLGFLDGFAGFVHIAIASSNTFYKYVKAISQQRWPDKSD